MKTPCEPRYFSDQSREMESSWRRKRNFFVVVISVFGVSSIGAVVAAIVRFGGGS